MAEHAQALIEDAHQQMAEARALAAEATAAAQEAAEQAHAHARAVAEKAEAQIGSADRVVKDARQAESALADEGGRRRTSRAGATDTGTAERAHQGGAGGARTTPADSGHLEDDQGRAGASHTECISGETAFLIKEGDVRIFHRKSRWQRLWSWPPGQEPGLRVQEPAIKGGAAAAMSAAALTAASAAVSSYRRRTNA